jgi:REP element-mobilizing transposase RayT
VLCLEEGYSVTTPNKFTRRNLPHWQIEGSTYFLTFRTAGTILDIDERLTVLGHITSGDNQFYRLAASVVMPDHCHLLLRPLPEYSLSRVMKGIKGVSARLINQQRGSQWQVWQDESYDSIVRDWKEFEEKLVYILENPVRAGLVRAPEEYPASYRSRDL